MAVGVENNLTDPIEVAETRSLLDRLFSDSRLYTSSADYMKLLEFVVRLRNFAPFNAMLLQVQKPGLSYAASAHDWETRFGRRPKEGARPLLILWPFGPVALVYDVLDTEGEELPAQVSMFPAHGTIREGSIFRFCKLAEKKRIKVDLIDAGDRKAGSIRLRWHPIEPDEPRSYLLKINRNHEPPTQFATLTHELGHLFLGHLGQDKALKIPKRAVLNDRKRELEAESVSYLVCARNGVVSKSEAYLSRFVSEHNTIESIDIYQVMRAAGHVEQVLGLSGQARVEMPR